MAIDPRWSKRLAIISMAVGWIVICACIVIFWRGSTTVILVIRHAERNDGPPSLEPFQGWNDLGNVSPRVVACAPTLGWN